MHTVPMPLHLVDIFSILEQHYRPSTTVCNAIPLGFSSAALKGCYESMAAHGDDHFLDEPSTGVQRQCLLVSLRRSTGDGDDLACIPR